MDLPQAVTAFEWLEEAADGSSWTYPAIAGAVALDALIPVAPGEAAMITAGVLAAAGEMSLVLVILAGTAGSMIGDNACYWLGASLGRRAERRLFSSPRAMERVDWAREQLQQRGGAIILAARFIPGGRTATTFSAGTLDFPWRRFATIDAVAALIWASYITLLGYFGGSTFEEDIWKPLLAAGAVAVVIAAAAELVRRARLT